MLVPDLCFQVLVNSDNALLQIILFAPLPTGAELSVHRLDGTVIRKLSVQVSRGVNYLTLPFGRKRKGSFIVRCCAAGWPRNYSKIIAIE